MTSFPTFSAFHEAVHGYQPFPWQTRLAESVMADGWPDLLSLPTGAGKTTALDVSLYCLAAAPERMPRRTVLVVDRRVVVDQGGTHAKKLLRAMLDARTGPAADIAAALRALAEDDDQSTPFDIAIMRGGMPRDNDWAKRPDRALLGVSTVDQLGSRLMFRGYGVSPLSAPIHAGLVGNDTLILLDEVHLAVPFAETLEQIRRHYRAGSGGLPERFWVCEMSATPRGEVRKTFSLGADDREHPVLRKRLEASKPTRLETVKVSGDDEPMKQRILAAAAVKAARGLQMAGATVVAIVVNRVDTARAAYELLAKETTTRRLLVTGRMRPLERDLLAREALVPNAGAGRDRAEAKPLIVVATQCIEAGADLDFDGLVTECASLDALRQRFGRVDRLGERGLSTCVILGRSDAIASGTDDPIYGTALANTWQWLKTNASSGSLDFGISTLPPGPDDRDPKTTLWATTQHAPVLLPAHLDVLAHTSPPRPAPDQDVSLWLHGPERGAAEVQIVWRAGVELPTSDEPEFLEDRTVATTEWLEAVRPSSLESLSLPIGAARAWLLSRADVRERELATGERPNVDADVETTDVVGVELADAPRSGRGRQEDRRIVAFRWDGEDSEFVSLRDIRPGDVLVVPVETGGLQRQEWDGVTQDWAYFDPAGWAPVLDLADAANLRARARVTMRLPSRVAVQTWEQQTSRDIPYAFPSLNVWGVTDEQRRNLPEHVDDEALAETRERVVEWLSGLGDLPPARWVLSDLEWQHACAALSAKAMRVSLVGPWLVVDAPARVVESEFGVSDLVTEGDDSSFRAAEVTLARHSMDVRDKARAFANRLRLGDAIASDLALAAWFHDVGKADPRFQRWLVGGSEVRAAALPEPLAKSALPPGKLHERRLARKRAGYPEGYRHELLSVAMIAAHPALRQAHDPDLVIHLVASHHGWCRPFAPPIDDAGDEQVRFVHDGERLEASTRHRLARLDSGVADRFGRLSQKYGWWGLAWIEAVLRLADHRASEEASTNLLPGGGE